MLRSQLLILILAGLLSTPLKSFAGLRFCNLTPMPINTAIGERIGNNWQARGWFPLAPGECRLVVGGNLTNRYYYYYGFSGKREWSGRTPFCTSAPDPFTITNGKCDAETIRDFKELDVEGAANYTLNFTCPECSSSKPH